MYLKNYDAVVVGGGLAGLTAAARLAKNNKKVLVIERSKLGGRAITVDLKGFSFNFGAHAIYGRDKSSLAKLEKELNIKINWTGFKEDKATYDLGDEFSDIPANFVGLLKTKMLKGGGKPQFVWEVLKTIIKLEKGDPHVSLKKWLDDQNYREDVKEMLLTLASSNFFTREADKIPSDVFFSYYNRIFKTNKPVSYIKGGWQTLIESLERVIVENGGEIKTKSKVSEVSVEKNKIIAVKVKEEEYRAKDFIFCIPPGELVKLFEGTNIDYKLKTFSRYQPSYVMYYDIGLKKRINSPFTYVYDKKNGIFLTDISYYDPDCAPEGGQLIQAVSYLDEKDVGDKEKFEEYKGKIESLYDKHFPGWREELVTNRISKQAVVQEIKWVMEQEAMPTYFPEYRNLFFAGDWCKGQGQLSELSFSSAIEASNFVLKK